MATAKDIQTMRRRITLILLVPLGLSALALINAGPFVLNVFGRGIPVRLPAGPAAALGALWIAGMIWPRAIWSARTGAAAALLILSSMAFCRLTLPGHGSQIPPPVKKSGAREPFKDYNLIVVSLDTLRADRVGAYGYRRNTTPALDRLARESVLFENAVSSAPATLSSHATAFTGLYPGAHGAQVMTHAALPSSALTLAEILKSRGYATGGFTGGAQLSRNFGMAQGFDAYKDDAMDMASIWPEARRWLDAQDGRKFFLFLHSYDIHTPYDPPPPFNRSFNPDYSGPLPDAITLDIAKRVSDGRIRATAADLDHINAQYDAGVRYTDTYIQALVDYLDDNDLLNSTLLVVMSDHGEELGERGTVGMHAHSLHAEALHVPLIMRLPGGGQGRRRAQRVGLVDLTPTLLDLLAIPYETGQFQGRSFAWLTGDGSARANGHQALLAEREHGHGERTGRAMAVYAGGFKLITRTPPPAEAFMMKWTGDLAYPARGRTLYDTQADPAESKDLLAARVQRARALDALAARMGKWNRSMALAGATAGVSRPERDKLKGLGYLQ